MSNAERLDVNNEKETVNLLLNKVQRHRGDTLNSREFLQTENQWERKLLTGLLAATVSARVTSPLEGIIGVKLVHW
jgi:alpha-D-xyloside xylohydrolase